MITDFPVRTALDFFKRTILQTAKKLFAGLDPKTPLWLCLPVCFLAVNAWKALCFKALITASPFIFSTADFLLPLLFAAFVYLLALRSPWRIVFAAVYALQLIYLWVNLSYHLYSENYLHISQYLGLFGEGADLISHGAIPHDPRIWFLALDVPLAAATFIWYPPMREACRRTIGRSFFIVNYLLILLIAVILEGDVFSVHEELDDQYAAQQAVVKRYGLLVFNLVDLSRYRSSKSLIASFATPDTLIFAGDSSRRRNVLFVQVESLDAWAVNCAYKGVRAMPFLHSLESRSIYYPCCMSYHKAGSTSDCEFSVINSIEALDEFPAMKIRDYGYPNSLARKFSEAGYAAVAFHANRGDYFNRSAAFKGMRFDRFNDMFRLNLAEVGWGAPDSALFSRVLDSLRVQKPPFMYYIITMTSHEPWELARQYFNNPRYNSIPDALSRDYLNSLEYVDRMIERFVDSVEAIRPNTVIIIYGDHSPGIKTGAFKQSALMHKGRYFEFVPLFILVPGAIPRREQNLVASFLDIEPTAIDAAGISGRIATRGVSLLSPPPADRTIPFKGAEFRRNELFGMIAEYQPGFARIP